MEKAILRVLVVDDFQPWRQFLLSTLQKLTQLRVIGEESDGLSAVHSAEQLKPDLIILDIGLPRLNGIDAARRIRKLSPDSRILFASADRSWETVEVALETGAGGYLVKTDAGTELASAIEAVIQGRPFVSSGVARERAAQAAKQESRDAVESDEMPQAQSVNVRHQVDFYLDDMALVNGFCRAIGTALKVGAAAVVIATASHHTQILERLASNGVDINGAIEKGSYAYLNTLDALEMIMTDGTPDPIRCNKMVGNLVARANKIAGAGGAQVTICGECAPTLLQQGNEEAAVQLEHVFDEVARQHKVDTLCGYLWSAFPEGENSKLFRRICAEHSGVRGRLTDDERTS